MLNWPKTVNNELRAVRAIARHHLNTAFAGERRHSWQISRPTVMLLHGYLVGAPSMQGLANYLHSYGYNVDNQPYPFWEDLKKIELQVGENLDRICQKAGESVNVVGHSMGGLIAYSLAQKHPAHFERLITLGTPFYGTLTASSSDFIASIIYFLSGQSKEIEKYRGSSRQLVPGSSYLEQLHAQGLPAVPLTVVYSTHDEIVIPWQNGRLQDQFGVPREDVEQKEVSDTGHGGLITRAYYPLILDLLKRKLPKDLEKEEATNQRFVLPGTEESIDDLVARAIGDQR